MFWIALKTSMGHLGHWTMAEAVVRAGRMRGMTAGKEKLFRDCNSLRERYIRERQLQVVLSACPGVELA